MNYIELINYFWELDETWQFSCCETRLYFYLVKTANRLGWENNWTHSDVKMSANVGVSVNSFKRARNKLTQSGLISFDFGGKNGRGDKTRYQILTPLRTPLRTPLEENTLLDEINININKTKPPTPFSTFETNFDFSGFEKNELVLIQLWLEYKKGRNEPLTAQCEIEALHRQISELGFEKAKKAIDHSIISQYKGIYEAPEKFNSKNGNGDSRMESIKRMLKSNN